MMNKKIIPILLTVFMMCGYFTGAVAKCPCSEEEKTEEDNVYESFTFL